MAVQRSKSLLDSALDVVDNPCRDHSRNFVPFRVCRMSPGRDLQTLSKPLKHLALEKPVISVLLSEIYPYGPANDTSEEYEGRSRWILRLLSRH